jgi:hypothetical protein
MTGLNFSPEKPKCVVNLESSRSSSASSCEQIGSLSLKVLLKKSARNFHPAGQLTPERVAADIKLANVRKTLYSIFVSPSINKRS